MLRSSTHRLMTWEEKHVRRRTAQSSGQRQPASHSAAPNGLRPCYARSRSVAARKRGRMEQLESRKQRWRLGGEQPGWRQGRCSNCSVRPWRAPTTTVAARTTNPPRTLPHRRLHVAPGRRLLPALLAARRMNNHRLGGSTNGSLRSTVSSTSQCFRCRCNRSRRRHESLGAAGNSDTVTVAGS